MLRLARQPETPLLTIAATLAVAALFTPLRCSIQDVIDRRFFRKKYNAEDIQAAFNAALKEEVDVERVSH